MRKIITKLRLLSLLIGAFTFSIGVLLAQNGPCGPGVGTILFEEDFEDEADAATVGMDANGTAWTATCPGCASSDFFEVDSNSGNAMGCNGTQGLRGNDTNGPGTFNVSGIDISTCEVVFFAFDYCSSGYTGSGNLECAVECAGCSGIPADGVSNGGCNNCWDFLYGELDYGSGTVQQILLGDDCDAPVSGTSGSPLCGSTAPDGTPIPPADLTNVDINIVMAMWAGAENMVIDNVSLICYSADDVAACADPTIASACPIPCGFTAGLSAVPDCDLFAIEVTNIVTSGTDANSMTPVAGTFEYSTDGGSTYTVFTPGTTTFVADGTTIYMVRLTDDDDTTCVSEVGMITAPTGDSPSCGAFPANGN